MGPCGSARPMASVPTQLSCVGHRVKGLGYIFSPTYASIPSAYFVSKKEEHQKNFKGLRDSVLMESLVNYINGLLRSRLWKIQHSSRQEMK